MAKRQMPKKLQEEKPIEEIVEEIVEESTEPVEEIPTNRPIKTGKVVNTERLNVRTEPDLSASIVCEINTKSEFEIDLDKSTEGWFYVLIAGGKHGFSMRDYIEVIE